MQKSKQRIVSTACALALASNSLVVFAQNGQNNGGQTQQPRVEVREQTVEKVIVTGDGQAAGQPHVIVRKSGAAPNGASFSFTGQDGHVVAFANGQGPGSDVLINNGQGNAMFMSFEIGMNGKTVKDAPYSAESVTEFTQVLADGNRIERRSSAPTYRDGQGRTRRDHTAPSTGNTVATSNTASMSFITDPLDNVMYNLDHKTKTVRKIKLPTPGTAIGTSNANGGGVFVFSSTSGSGAMPAGDAPRRIQIVTDGSGSGANVERIRINGTPGAGIGSLANMAIQKVQPVYPAEAKAAKVQGKVQVKVTVGDAGEVLAAEAISGEPLLREAAVAAARQWKFKPAEINGATVKTQGTITFNFTLQEKEQAFDSGLELKTEATRINAAAGAIFSTNATPPTVESLGKQMIEGIECDGKRITMSIPAGTMGNQRAIEIVTESWYAPSLQLTLLTKQSDPRNGTTVTKLTNIVRAEPDFNLFKVPSDYTIKEEPLGFKLEERRIMKQENE